MNAQEEREAVKQKFKHFNVLPEVTVRPRPPAPKATVEINTGVSTTQCRD